MSHEHRHEREQHYDHGGETSSGAELAGFLSGLAEFPRRALDLGCGTGSEAVFLAEQGIETAGVDLSAAALNQARERALRHEVHVDWLLGDVLELPLDDGSIDLALDRGCLHHLTPAEQTRYATEVARALRPGGTLLIREMNEPSHHEHAVSEADIRRMVASEPLRVRSIVTYRLARGDRTLRTMFAVVDRD
jgi:ubiquinone/menaquinone biosynthesis C-methylase UbiE